MTVDHSVYASPFSWRYGSKEMRELWSEKSKRKLMRKVWNALAYAQHQAGIVSYRQLVHLLKSRYEVDIERSLEIEEIVKHDVVAELYVYKEDSPIGASALHLGATSADITDNVDALRLRTALSIVIDRLHGLLSVFPVLIQTTSYDTVMGFTHLQEAEPTTVGYRLSVYAQDLLSNLLLLRQARKRIKGKGFKGAVGTQAAYTVLLEGSDLSPERMEEIAMEQLSLPYYAIATQTYTRMQDLHILNTLSETAASLHKFGLDLRLLQSPLTAGNWTESFGEYQIGSSAIPFKKNPISAENICSLARLVASYATVAWGNASQNILERTLDDSANRRTILAESFLASEEMLIKATDLLSNLDITNEEEGEDSEYIGTAPERAIEFSKTLEYHLLELKTP